MLNRDGIGAGRVALEATLALLPGLLALLPLLGGLPATQDGTQHLLRAAMYPAIFATGTLVPDWYPDFANSYGYPLGLFYPPLAGLISGLITVLTGSPIIGQSALIVLCALVGSFGAYLLGRQLGRSPWSGLVAAAVFVLAPYQLANLFIRGAAPEALSIALAPWALWAIGRWEGQRSRLISTTLMLSLVFVAHNLIAVFTWLLAALIWGGWSIARHAPARLWAIGIVPFLLADALTAWYWLPAALESQQVSLGVFRGVAATNLVPFTSLVSYAPVFPYGREFFSLGVLHLIILVAGAVDAGATRRWMSLGAVAVAVVLLLIMTPMATPIWATGLLDPVQFPWRLMGLVALAIAVSAVPLGAGRYGWVIASVLTIALAVSGLVGLKPARFALPDEVTTRAGAVRWEYDDRAIGTTISGEYLPSAVRQAFRAAADSEPVRDDSAGPPLVSANLLTLRGNEARFQVRAEQPTRLLLHQFAFNGRWATVNGNAVPVRAVGPLGVAGIDVPIGTHIVATGFMNVPRAVGWGIALVTILVLVVWRWPNRTIVGASIAVGVLVVVVNVMPRTEQPLNLTPADFGSALRLTGGAATATSDGLVHVRLVWQSLQQYGQDLVPEVTLIGEGVEVRQDARPIWNTSMTTGWMQNQIVMDDRSLAAPPGRYVVHVRVLDQDVRVGEVTVGGSRPPVAPPLSGSSVDRLGLTWDIVGTGADGVLSPGSTVTVTIGWDIRRALLDDQLFRIDFVSLSGESRPVTRSPEHGLPLFSLSQPGATGKLVLPLPVPADIQPGRHQLRLRISPFRTSRPPDLPETVILGTFKGPPATTVPIVEPAQLSAGEVRLTGISTADDMITLVWKADGRPTIDWMIRVEFFDAGGSPVGSTYGHAQENTYPATLWSAGESVIDLYDIPDRASRVSVRLVNPATTVATLPVEREIRR